LYARKYVHPKLNEIDKEKVTNFYAEIRKQSSVAGGIPIAVRHIESMLRMSEAHAKMHLRDYVRSDDIDFAIEMLCGSFLQSQKTSVATSLKPKLDPFIEKNKTGTYQLLMHILDKLSSEKAVFKKFQEGIEEDQLIKVEFKVKDFEA